MAKPYMRVPVKKICNRCGLEKTVNFKDPAKSEFSFNYTPVNYYRYPVAQCKPCRVIINREIRARNKQREQS